jgi:hypothetical protein
MHHPAKSLVRVILGFQNSGSNPFRSHRNYRHLFGELWVTATISGGHSWITKHVSVVIPSKIRTPHNTSGVYSAANLALDATTQPAAQGLPAGKVLLSTVYMRWLTINVWDQFDASIGDIYAGAPVAEVSGGTTYFINDTITSSGTYLDPTGLEVDNDDRVDAGSTEATTWYSQPKFPIPVAGRTGTQNITVKVDGFTLNPSIVSRTWTASSPNTLTISWPN